jgi:hypothetical protein
VNKIITLYKFICIEILNIPTQGYEVKTEGDAFMIAFDSIFNAVKFALQAQEMLLLADWPSTILTHPSTSVVKTNKGLLFRGIRVRMV